MSDKLMMYILNDDIKITLAVDYNKCLQRLDTQLNESTNQHLVKVPNVVEPIRKRFYKTFED